MSVLAVLLAAACAKSPAPAPAPAPEAAPVVLAPPAEAPAPGLPGDTRSCAWEWPGDLSALKPMVPHDGIVARVRTKGRVDTSSHTVHGTCEGACAEAVAAGWDASLRTAQSLAGETAHQLAWSEGGTLQPIGGRKALAMFLGPTDTAEEALLWSYVFGYDPACTATKRDDGTWSVEAIQVRGDCPLTVQGFTLSVLANGDVAYTAARDPVQTTTCR